MYNDFSIEDYNKILRAERVARCSKEIKRRRKTIHFECPICGNTAISTYFKEKGQLIGNIKCSNCKVAFIIRKKRDKYENLRA